MTLSLNREHLGAYKDVALLFFKYSGNDEIKQDAFGSDLGLDSEIEPSDDAEEFTADLERLGPTYIKVGQLLSTRADLLPSSWITALQRLQDDVGSFPFEQVRETIEDELGVRVSKLFETIDEEPIASASLGQVHHAVLRNSETEVAVKVQRPGIRSMVMKELEAICEMAEFFENHSTFGKKFEIGRMADQFRKTIIAELNYNQEASNLARLRENLQENPLLLVPAPHMDFCSSKVLTMDFIAGTKITDLSGVVHTEIDGKALSEAVFSSYLEQILVDGFFHADPHPGNLLITPDHRIALIDLGMVGSIPDGQKDFLLQLLAAASEGRSTEAANVAQKIGTPRMDYDEAACRAAIIEIVESRQGQNVEQLQVGEMVMDVTNACGMNGLRIPNSMYMLGKMLLNLDGVGKSLDPRFNPDECVRKYTTELARKRLRDEFTLGGLVSLLTDVKDLVAHTPTRLNELLKMLANNELSINVDAIDEDQLLRGLHRIANRITMGLVLAALIIGVAMLMNIESEFTVLGYPGLAIILFLAAAIGGFLLVINIWLSERETRK